MSTGVDAQTCKLIVLDKRIGSMTEFKQIIGRGTRINEDYNKLFFTIMDFKRATALFADPDFDGDPVQIYEPIGYPSDEDPGVILCHVGCRHRGRPASRRTNPGGTTSTTWRSPSSASVSSTMDTNGKLITESLRDYTRKTVRQSYGSLGAFLNAWNDAARKQAIIDELAARGVFVEDLAEQVGQGPGYLRPDLPRRV
jgi:type I restriction enzyme R subunit